MDMPVIPALKQSGDVVRAFCSMYVTQSRSRLDRDHVDAQPSDADSLKSLDQRLWQVLASVRPYFEEKKLSELSVEIAALISKGANPNGETGGGELLLMSVIDGNHFAVRELLTRGADPHIDIRLEKGSTSLLHVAVSDMANLSGPIIAMLLAKGLDPFGRKDSEGSTAKSLSLERLTSLVTRLLTYPLHWSVKNKDIDLCATFLERGFSEEETDSNGDTPASLARDLGRRNITALFDSAKALHAIEGMLKMRSSSHSLR